MTIFTFDAKVAYSPLLHALAQNVVGSIYLDTDTAYATALTVTPEGGSASTLLQSLATGLIPRFTLDQAANGLTGTQGARVVWKSGQYVVPITSQPWLVEQVTTGAVAPARVRSVVPSGADQAAAVQAAQDALGPDDTLRLVGAYTIGSTVTFTKNLDASAATFTYTGTGIAVQVGSATSGVAAHRRTIALPHVVYANKPATGWTAGTTGVRISNLFSSQVTVPEVRGFETGLSLFGIGTGVSYVNIHLGHLDNNKVNLTFGAGTGGWANQNTVIGGRCSHDSAEGTQVAGTRHVVHASATNLVNGNALLGTSLESPNVVEYHIETFGQYNTFLNCRFENTGGDAARRVWSRGTAKANAIVGGFNAGQLTQVKEATAMPFAVDSEVQVRRVGGSTTSALMLLENNVSSSGPILRALGAGATANGDNPASVWTVEMTAAKLRGKQAADTQPRADLDFSTGRLWLGPGGSTAPVMYLSGGTGGFVVGGGNFYFDTDNTRDIGTAGALRPRYVRVGTAVQTGSGATGSRPAAATAGAGAMWFDTTLGRPIWSTGSAWVDATGATV